MEKVVCNSSPIIHLAKLDLLELLHDYYRSVSVPESAYNECISGGNEKPEVNKIRDAKWIKVLKAKDHNLVRLLGNNLDQANFTGLKTQSSLASHLKKQDRKSSLTP